MAKAEPFGLPQSMGEIYPLVPLETVFSEQWGHIEQTLHLDLAIKKRQLHGVLPATQREGSENLAIGPG